MVTEASADGAKWYYLVRGDVTRHGVVDRSGLFDMAGQGRLKPSDLVWNRDAGAQWVAASTVEGLFAERPAAVPAGRAQAARPPRGQPGGRPWHRRYLLIALILLGIAVFSFAVGVSLWFALIR
ncbi:GYF domain-containing protein [Verrucomicrobiota bacterium]